MTPAPDLRPSRLRILEQGRPDRWLADAGGRTTADQREAHVAPFITMRLMADLMGEYARLTDSLLQFEVEDAS